MGTALLAICSMPALSGAEGEFANLAELFRADAPMLPKRVAFHRGETKVVESRFVPGQRMRRIELEFTSQVYRGLACRHQAVMLLPPGEIRPEARGKAAIVLGGSVLDVRDAALDWIEYVVVKLGVPAIVVKNTLPAKELGARNPGELMSAVRSSNGISRQLSTKER